MYTDLNSVKSYLGISLSTTETSYDTLLNALITISKTIISNYLNQDIDSAEKTQTISGNGGTMVMLRSHPCTSLSKVYSKTETTETEIAGCSLFTNDFVSKVYNPSVFTKGVDNYRIVFTAGYTSIPEPVKQVATEIVAVMFKESSAKTSSDGRLGLSVETKNYNGFAETNQYKDEWNKWKQYLNEYKFPTV